LTIKKFCGIIIALVLIVALLFIIGLQAGWSTVNASGSCGPKVTRDALPKEIRVRYYGKTYSVPFKKYVKQVMVREWPAHMKMAALKAGAVAVKQYAWYYVAHPRFGTGSGCYHVVATTADQLWAPYDIVHPRHRVAVNKTWGLRLTKTRKGLDKFFATGYRRDYPRTGWHLSARRAAQMARQGKHYKHILRYHYKNAVLHWV
jgi:peptidoglycan hydrolase-like amidase